MAVPLHPAASHHLPWFITAPGETDILMVVTAVILAASILGFGILFFRLHHLPEQVAHGSKKIQLEIVSVLCLIGLLTHIHAFWVVALLLAMIDIPDFGGALGRIAGAVERMAGLKVAEVAARPPEASADAEPSDAKPLEGTAAAAREARSPSAKPKEPIHA
jgi:hypothetical protein